MSRNGVIVFSVLIISLIFVSISCGGKSKDKNYFIGSIPSTSTSSATDTDTSTSTDTATGTDTTVYDIAAYIDFANTNYWWFRDQDRDTRIDYYANNSTTFATYTAWPVTVGNSSFWFHVEYYALDNNSDLICPGHADPGNLADTILYQPPIRYGLSAMSVGTTWNDSGVFHYDNGSDYSYTSDWTFLGTGTAELDNSDLIPDCIKIEQILHVSYPVPVDETRTYYWDVGGGVVMKTTRLGMSDWTPKLVDSNAIDP